MISLLLSPHCLEQTCIKGPGTINGQLFIIEDCEDCDIYVCDHLAQVVR